MLLCVIGLSLAFWKNKVRPVRCHVRDVLCLDIGHLKLDAHPLATDVRLPAGKAGGATPGVHAVSITVKRVIGGLLVPRKQSV